MGVGPIPLTVIWAYADRYECPPWFTEAMQTLDLEFLKAENAGAKKPRPDPVRR